MPSAQLISTLEWPYSLDRLWIGSIDLFFTLVLESVFAHCLDRAQNPGDAITCVGFWPLSAALLIVVAILLPTRKAGLGAKAEEQVGGD